MCLNSFISNEDSHFIFMSFMTFIYLYIFHKGTYTLITSWLHYLVYCNQLQIFFPFSYYQMCYLTYSVFINCYLFLVPNVDIQGYKIVLNKEMLSNKTDDKLSNSNQSNKGLNFLRQIKRSHFTQLLKSLTNPCKVTDSK